MMQQRALPVLTSSNAMPCTMAGLACVSKGAIAVQSRALRGMRSTKPSAAAYPHVREGAMLLICANKMLSKVRTAPSTISAETMHSMAVISPISTMSHPQGRRRIERHEEARFFR